RLRNVTLRDLARYDWILPARGTPRREAFEQLFAGAPRLPTVSIETTSPSIHRPILATTDRIALLATLEARFAEPAGLTVLAFDSPILAGTDGVASRADWQPTSLHRQLLDLLREQARDYENAHQAVTRPAPVPAL